MTTTVTTNLMPMNVTASFEASDNSAGDSFWRGNGGRSEEKKAFLKALFQRKLGGFTPIWLA